MANLVAEVPTLTGLTWEVAKQLRTHDDGCARCQVGGIVYPNAKLSLEVDGGVYRTETGGTQVLETRCAEGERLENRWLVRRDIEDAPVRGDAWDEGPYFAVPAMSFDGWKLVGGRG